MSANPKFHDFRATVHRNNYNKKCKAYLALQDDCVTMGTREQNIEIGHEGISLNSGGGGLVAINCMSFMGPFTMKTPWPFDMVPGMVSPFPGGINYAAGLADIPALAGEMASLMNLV